MFTFKENRLISPSKLNRIGDFKFIDDKKAILECKQKSGKHIVIVFKQSERHKNKIMFAVFKKTSINKWSIQEVDYYSNIAEIENYVYNKYFSEQKGIC